MTHMRFNWADVHPSRGSKCTYTHSATVALFEGMRAVIIPPPVTLRCALTPNVESVSISKTNESPVVSQTLDGSSALGAVATTARCHVH